MWKPSRKLWDILETTYEDTSAIKNSKLQMLVIRFEIIRMEEDESFDEFYARLLKSILQSHISKKSRIGVGSHTPIGSVVGSSNPTILFRSH